MHKTMSERPGKSPNFQLGDSARDKNKWMQNKYLINSWVKHLQFHIINEDIYKGDNLFHFSFSVVLENGW